MTPTWTAGKYIWQRMKYTYTDNSVKYSTPVCIQGAKGEDAYAIILSPETIMIDCDSDGNIL